MDEVITRSERTPTTEANIILTNLNDAYQRLVVDRNGNRKTQKEFRLKDVQLHETDFFKDQILSGAMKGDDLVAAHKVQYPANTDGIFSLDELHAIVISLAFCIEALRADACGERDLAWTLVIDSRTWLTASLSLKPMRIEKIKRRKKTSIKRSNSAKIRNSVYKPYIDFILKEYRAGHVLGSWTNPHQAKNRLEVTLNNYMKVNNFRGLCENNLNDWIYRTLIENLAN